VADRPDHRWTVALGSALLEAGFSQAETEQLLGGNDRRVFEASMSEASMSEAGGGT
jgi:hypothetical protein